MHLIPSVYKIDSMISLRTGQINQSHNAKIGKWREVFAGKILEQSQVEYQKPIGEGKLA